MTAAPKGEKKPRPKRPELHCVGITFRGVLIQDADGNKLPGYAEAGRACTAALLAPRLVAGEGNHAAD